MKTTISKENILKSNILFSTITAFILSVLLFTSCSDNESIDFNDDSVLISKIESASKTSVNVSSLPSETISILSGDLADSYLKNVQLATGLGYKVSLTTDNAEREELNSEVYFSAKGRQLKDNNEKRKRKRNKCFEFVFPIDFIMADDSSITLNSKEDWILIKDWHQANPDETERPQLVFPVEITLKEDGSTQTLIDSDELNAIKDSCKRGKDKRKCFKLVLPVNFTMPDATVIEVNEKQDFKLLREWHKANPNVTEKGSINFPVNIEYKDGTTETITNESDYTAAKESCKD